MSTGWLSAASSAASARTCDHFSRLQVYVLGGAASLSEGAKPRRRSAASRVRVASRPTRTTLYPALTISRAVTEPSPEAPPVMTAVFLLIAAPFPG